MAQHNIDMNATNKTEENNVSENYVSNSSRPVSPRVVVDAIHPRFLAEGEKPPECISAATEENFCQQCKMVFGVTPEAVRDHFRKIVHNSALSCTYCNGVVYEYYFETEKKYAHDCNLKTKK